MGWVILILIICGVGAYLLWASSQLSSSGRLTIEPPPTEAELLQARLDLYRIERGVDLAIARQEQRQEAERIKQAIADALEDDR